MNNSKTSVREAQNWDMIAGTGNMEQVSVITAFSGFSTPEKTHQGNIILTSCWLNKEITYLCHMFQG